MLICNHHKVFYHLEELDDALRYALGAGPKFDVTSGSEYVQTLLSKCIDEYIRLRVAAYENKEDAAAAAAIDPRLVAIVERMFEKCFTEVRAHMGRVAAFAENELLYAVLGE
jgi:26S proteasome regulatory subunit N2